MLLPVELVIAIAGSAGDYFNLSRSCKVIHRVLVGRRWNDLRINLRPCWMDGSSQPVTRCKSVRDGTVEITSAWQMTRLRNRQCLESPCEACEIETALISVNAYLNSRGNNVDQGLRELTLSGWLPQTLKSVRKDAPGHSFKDTRGVCGISPEVLNIELQWATWSPLMLGGFDLARLRSLKMPVRAPVDCLKIGAAFLDMPHLATLTITELPDSQDFVDEFRHLGDGIMALSSSLRSLDIGMINCNRPEGWEQDEAFVEPGDVAFFFEAFFPEPSRSLIETLVRARYDDPREPLDVNILRSSKGQLNLESIRLKHIGLPWWAFQTVFSPGTLKELDLPMCRIAPSIWDDLGKHANLHKLANINYEMLSGSFMIFLSSQSCLQSLSFTRPPDIYNIAGVMSNFTSFEITEAAPHLGPGTEWGRAHARTAWLLQSSKSWIQNEHLIHSPSSWSYFENLIRSLTSYDDYQYPKKSVFVKNLSDKVSMKHLVLPADMFDITPGFMACLASESLALESIELGFDYACPRLCECFIKDFLPRHPHLKKITFLSLNRPHPLSDFNAKHMHPVFESYPHDVAPASLKYVRYRDLNDNSHQGEHTESDVYYHRESMANGSWWMKIPVRKSEIMFEEETTPAVCAIEMAGSKVERANSGKSNCFQGC